MSLRLQKYLRDCLGVSRRKAEILIEEGLISVNGRAAELGMSVEPETDRVVYQGKIITVASSPSRTIMLNKPLEVVTTRFDPQKRKTVYALLPASFRNLFPVGRLDYLTEGLLLMTDNGDLAYRLTHPKFEVEKEYIVLIGGNLLLEHRQKLEQGLKTPDLISAPAKVTILQQEAHKTLVGVVLHEGQKREVRRMFQHFGYRVLSLRRVRIDSLRLGDLPSGQYRELSQKEIADLLLPAKVAKKSSKE